MPSSRPHLTLSSHTIPVPPELPPAWAAFPAHPPRHGPQGAISFHPEHLKGSCVIVLFFSTSVFPQENVGSTGAGPLCGNHSSLQYTEGAAHDAVLCLAAQSCPTLCESMDCSPPGSSAHKSLQERILEWVAMPSSRGSSQPGIEPRSPALQVNSLPAEPPGKPKNTGVGCHALLQGIFPTQESNQGLLHCR